MIKVKTLSRNGMDINTTDYVHPIRPFKAFLAEHFKSVLCVPLTDDIYFYQFGYDTEKKTVCGKAIAREFLEKNWPDIGITTLLISFVPANKS